MGACEHYEELISAFIDGVLAEEDRAVLMEHMSGCAGCQAYFDDQIAIHDAMDTEPIQAPGDFADTVMKRVRETPQGRPGRRTVPLRPWWRWVAAAACCAIVMLGIWNFQNLTGTRAPDEPGLPAGAARSVDETEDAFDESDAEKWAVVTETYEPTAKMKEEPEDSTASDAPVDVTERAEAEPAPEPAEAPPVPSADAEDETEETPAEGGIMPTSLSLEDGKAIVDVLDSDSTDETILPPVADYEFSNGSIRVYQMNEKLMWWFLEDTESVVYNGETFFVKEASREGYTCAQYYPDGADGLGYSGTFVSETEQEEVFELILSLVIP